MGYLSQLLVYGVSILFMILQRGSLYLSHLNRSTQLITLIFILIRNNVAWLQ